MFVRGYFIFIATRASNAEVDYVISHHGQVIPIEVKSGLKGQMQSLYLFLEEKKLPLGLRVSSENFGAYDKIKTIPLYAVPQVYH